MIEGEEIDTTLFKMVKDTMKATDGMIGQGASYGHLMRACGGVVVVLD